MKTDPKEAIAVLNSLTVKILFIVSTLITGAFFSALFVNAHINMFRLENQNALLLWALPIIPLSIYATAHISWEYLNTSLLKVLIEYSQGGGYRSQKILATFGAKSRWIAKQLSPNSSKEKEVQDKITSILQKANAKIDAESAGRKKYLKGLEDSVDDVEGEFEKATVHKYFAKIVIKFSLIVLLSLNQVGTLHYVLAISIAILLLHIGMLRVTVKISARIVLLVVGNNYELINERAKMWWRFRGVKHAIKKWKSLTTASSS